MIVSYFILLKCRLFINQGFKSTYHFRNKKPRLESIKLQSGYEPNLNIKKLYHDVGASFHPDPQ